MGYPITGSLNPGPTQTNQIKTLTLKDLGTWLWLSQVKGETFEFFEVESRIEKLKIQGYFKGKPWKPLNFKAMLIKKYETESMFVKFRSLKTLAEGARLEFQGIWLPYNRRRSEHNYRTVYNSCRHNYSARTVHNIIQWNRDRTHLWNGKIPNGT